MSDPLEIMSNASATLLAKWAITVAAMPEVSPDQIEVSAEFVMGNAKCKMSFQALETSEGDPLTQEAVENMIQKQREAKEQK